MTGFPSITMSRRFDKAYRKCSARLQGLVEGAVHDVVNNIRSSPSQASQNYDRHAKIAGVLEIDVSGACRMLAIWENSCLHLLDVGGHEVVPRYDKGKFFVDCRDRRDVPAVFWPEGPDQGLRFFSSSPSLAYSQFGNEHSEEWLFYLSDEQVDVLLEVAVNLLDDLKRGHELSPICIIGGPGTGKTCVLINLLKEFLDAGHVAKVRMSEQMLNFVHAFLPGMDIYGLATDIMNATPEEIVLVDDPKDAHEVSQWLDTASRKRIKAVIIGFDPCQLSGYSTSGRTSGITDAAFGTMCDRYSVKLLSLNDCYRQKENVGKAAKKAMDAIADSTPFLADRKIAEFRENHECLTSLSNDLNFPNPYGYTHVFEHAAWSDVENELRRIVGHPLWTHWTPVLIVVDPSIRDLVGDLTQRLGERTRCEIRLTTEVEEIKGLEFQHVFLFLGESLFRQLESGFTGSGQAEYTARRLMRIPISRAKDSLVTFVFGSEAWVL